MSTPNYRHYFKLSIWLFVLYNIKRMRLVFVNNLIKVVNFSDVLPSPDVWNLSFIVNFLKFKTSPRLSNITGYIVN